MKIDAILIEFYIELKNLSRQIYKRINLKFQSRLCKQM